MSIVTDIKESLKAYDDNAVVSFGRPLDNAAKSFQKEINSYLICIDPPTVTGGFIDSNETKSVSISWLKLDDADSEADKEMNEADIESMEEIVDDCETKAKDWLQQFKYEQRKKYSIDSFSGFPAFRVKHMVTGFVLTFPISYRQSC